jgi:hypothetical protein
MLGRHYLGTGHGLARLEGGQRVISELVGVDHKAVRKYVAALL